jgi:hypothetical protein
MSLSTGLHNYGGSESDTRVNTTPKGVKVGDYIICRTNKQMSMLFNTKRRRFVSPIMRMSDGACAFPIFVDGVRRVLDEGELAELANEYEDL